MQNDPTNRQGRLFLALFLSLAVWMGINYVFFPPPPPKPKNIEKDSKETAETKDPNSTKPEIKPQTKIEEKVSNLSKVNPTDIKTYSLRTDSFLVKFSSLGGRITEYYIKDHKEPDGSEFIIAKDPKFQIEFEWNFRKSRRTVQRSRV